MDLEEEFTVARVKALAHRLDVIGCLPDDRTIYGCLGTILGMFRHRVDAMAEEHAKALALSREEGRREGMERSAEIADRVAAEMEKLGRAEKPDSHSRDRLFARSRTASGIATAIRSEAKEERK